MQTGHVAVEPTSSAASLYPSHPQIGLVTTSIIFHFHLARLAIDISEWYLPALFGLNA